MARTRGPWAAAPCVDVGLGQQAHTTREWATWLRGRWPHVSVVGIDNLPERVQSARAHTPADGLRYEVGAFVPPGQQPLRLVRALNLLRGYPEGEVRAAWRAMGRGLLPGGLLVEGGTDKTGSVLVTHLLRRTDTGLEHEAMLFATDLSRGFAPAMFRGVLPRLVRSRDGPGLAVRGFLDRWTACWERTPTSARPEERFRASARRVRAAQLYPGLLRWQTNLADCRFSLAPDEPPP